MLYGIARQESRFVSDIVSSAGAVGLMQLMPRTARWVAKQLGRTDYPPTQIADVAINTQFGAFYFKYWQDRLDRMPALAAAAYNAGPSRAQAWRAGAPLEGAIWVETIPFNETRDYVKRVLANTMFYTRALDRPYVAAVAAPWHRHAARRRRRHRRAVSTSVHQRCRPRPQDRPEHGATCYRDAGLDRALKAGRSAWR